MDEPAEDVAVAEDEPAKDIVRVPRAHGRGRARGPCACDAADGLRPPGGGVWSPGRC
jgi:hypothetical protein